MKYRLYAAQMKTVDQFTVEYDIPQGAIPLKLKGIGLLCLVPEPPKAGGLHTIVTSKRKRPDLLIGEESLDIPELSAQSEAKLPLSWEQEWVEAEKRIIYQLECASRGTNTETVRVSISGIKANLEQLKRLAALWPKAGQVPSVDYCQSWLLRHIDSLEYLDLTEVGQIAEALHREFSRMGQPAKPVTAEKLAKWIKADAPNRDELSDTTTDFATRILQAFPTLGSGRLTRDEMIRRTKARLGILVLDYPGLAEAIADDLLAEEKPPDGKTPGNP